MTINQSILERIQRLQFTDRPQAERLTAQFIGRIFPQLQIASVRLRPQAISLNSFNGFLTLTNGDELFFKTHVEQDGVIQEYYNAAMLAQAGYPVIQPLYTSEQADQQILIYEVVNVPSVFDTARALETVAFDAARFERLREAQNASDRQLYALYEQTLADASQETVVAAPIHQLFYHRLTGGRLDRFYGGGTSITLPHQTLPLAEVRQKHWVINGAEYTETIETLIAQAVNVLDPGGLPLQTVIGHGDAHNGNVFFDEQQRTLTYFDPAFAGRHHPLLDLVKPLFHNVFAMWMYFPEQEVEKLRITLREEGQVWHIDHNYELNPIREMFLESKILLTLVPLLELLHQRDLLPANWRELLKLGLFCCPFLTLDLKRFPPLISLLGLTMAVQMGAESVGQRSVIDQTLDRVAAQVNS
jgi:hypothetical protein